jgi:hypothetical protein
MTSTPNNAANVVAPKPNIGGGAYVAPLATALPTDSTTALVAAYVNVGYIDAKGVIEANGQSLNKVTAWGGDVVKVVRTGLELTYQFVMLETLGTAANQLTYGAPNVTTTAATLTLGNATAIKQTGQQLPNQVFVFDMIDGIASVRIAIPNGLVTSLGNVTYSDTGAAMYDVTVTAFPDSTGVKAYKYLNDGKHL